jgi:hypothetical protein
MDDGGALRTFQLEHQKKLAEQARRAEEEQEKIRATARADIEKFKRERTAKVNKAKEDNRAEEQGHAHDKEKEDGNPWERIVQLIDLKSGKTEGKDVSSMRRILVEAKHLPIKSK